MNYYHDFTFNRRQFMQFAGGAVTIVTVAACTSTDLPDSGTAQNNPSTATEPQAGGILRLAPTDDVTSLDPGTVTSAGDILVGALLYNTLTRGSVEESGVVIHHPELAESWEMNEDATVHTFYLRQGVTFQHGTPFTAQDVEYTINRVLDPALGASVSASLQTIERIEIVDDFTIQFHLTAPNVTLPNVFGGPSLYIVPHDRTTEQLRSEPSGTGPFVLAERVVGERVVASRNENYWEEGLPYLDEVQLLIIPEPATQIAALTGGTVDMLYQVGLESVATLENTPDIDVVESPMGFYPLFVMNVTAPPFDDVRVRQAFKHAFDRTAMHAAILQGSGAVGNDQPIAPGTPFWADVQPLEYDVEKAQALLAEAGYADGLEVTLSTADIGGPRINDAAVVLQEMLKAAGITMQIDKVPAGTFYAEKYMQTPFFISWWPILPEPDGVLSLGYSAQAFFNESGWTDPDLDALIEAGRGEQDMEQRQQIYAEAQQIISEQGGVIIPYFAPYLQAIRTNVKDLTPGLRPVFQTMWLAQE